ncbi:thioredoxin family protein [Flavobacterium agricola]|uniref:Thioredoxin family protein n=1 Tax=Flavobacterium agricola TaxID=2870839 RepID=A0ABY6M376_9FLAO|nr:thioredoxin family protein [Flavobacterium agricola]UYW02322.1 thioredoxin family protein [Flavobacterium agricola]
MKKLILLACLFTNAIFAQIQFEQTLTETFNKAKKENKGVFIEFYNETCHHCQRVQPILASKEVGDVYNKTFVSYKINTFNGLTEEEEDFLKKHKLFFTDVPNFVYFDKNENFLHYTTGKPEKNFIINLATDAFNPQVQASKLGERVKNGDKSLATLYQYSALAQLNQDKALADEIADMLYNSFNKNQLGNDTSYIILKNAVFTTNNGFYTYWVNNLNKLKGLDSGQLKNNEVDILKNIISIDLTDPNFKWTPQSFEQLKKYMLATGYTSKPENILVSKRVEFFDAKNPSKEINSYFEGILKDNAYELEDKVYILGALNSELKNKQAKKEITKFADLLLKQAKTANDADAIAQLENIKK